MSPIDREKWKNDLAKYKEELRRLRYLSAYTSGTRWGQFAWLEFRADHDFLLRLGKSKPPKSELGETTDISVTDFSKWVFSLYRPTVDRESLETGKEVERAIAARISVPKLSGYELVYADPLNRKPKPLKISSLIYKGRPMWGAPDLVLRKGSTGEVVIIERKSSRRPPPQDGWPNLRAQLWAYGHCDEFADATSISLVGQIWNHSAAYPRLGAIVRWNKDDPTFDAENLELFELFGGERNVKPYV